MTPSNTTVDDLLAAIRAATTTPGLVWAGTPVSLDGGFWAEMWRIRLTGASSELSGDLVARVMPNPAVGQRETLVQAHLARAGFATPVVRLAAGPGAHLDRSWMIMDFAAGNPMLDDLSGPSALARLPQIARDMPDRLASHSAELHGIDPSELSQTLGGDDDIGGLLEQLADQARELGHTDLLSLVRWLQRHRAGGNIRAICHGDLHPFNILTAPSGDTILDWSAARIAHPAYDLAFTNLLLSHPPLVAPRPVRPAINLAGKALGRRFLRTYAAVAHTTIDADRLDWFTILHALRILTEVAVWDAGDELGDHPGHPFLTLRGPLTSRVAEATGIDLGPVPVS